MPHYTCITENRESGHLTQHEADRPEEALRRHIASYPFDDGAGPFGAELDWLRRVATGATPVSLLPVTDKYDSASTAVTQCRNTWFWREGASYSPKYLTYIIKTDIRPD